MASALDEENLVSLLGRPLHDLLAVGGQPGVPVLSRDTDDGEAIRGHARFSARACSYTSSVASATAETSKRAASAFPRSPISRRRSGFASSSRIASASGPGER